MTEDRGDVELSDSATGSALAESVACRRAYSCVLAGFLPMAGSSAPDTLGFLEQISKGYRIVAPLPVNAH